ncbi:NAD(P)/FAD-dependent oxidoreductase [Oscillibacter hominis]|uniref:NAD(P)/FAD-dependent oxidoreductase n=1 Tax=Oscillibacter hominis TaxID=2763056 RepID=UPI00298BEE34|nr:FAD-binding protein [Oscillibacter hominis]
MNRLLKLEGLKLAPGQPESALWKKAARELHVPAVESLRVLRRSIDARDGLFFVYSVAVTVQDEEAVLRRHPRLSRYEEPLYLPPAPLDRAVEPPVVVGAGPAGLFCALLLARAGARPILLEQGQGVEQRRQDVERFWSTGELNTRSNVQFGEGGAGAFSDGKLNTGTRDIRHRWILRQLVSWGAPEDILIDAKPHVGTDRLHVALQGMRRTLLDAGCDIRFGHALVGIHSRDGAVASLDVEGPGGLYSLPARQVVLAPGHSARDTFFLLQDLGVHLEAKSFSVGVRIEHSQSDMDAAQYKRYAGHPCLPASSYKLSCHLSSGRAVYSFCVCPGGQVVAAASEEGRVVTNGMSEFARDGENINGGLLVSVTPEDYGGGRDALAGIAFQRRLEEAAYALGGGCYRAPAQRVEDFLAGRPSTGPGAVRPTYRPGVTYTDLRRCLPPFVADAIAQALPLLGRKVRGYDAPDALLTAVESRSSSPVRIVRDETYQSSLRGLYPCGEGAGYAGGILSAAADGMKCAEQIWEVLQHEA